MTRRKFLRNLVLGVLALSPVGSVINAIKIKNPSPLAWYKGTTWLSTGYIYAPWIPVTITPAYTSIEMDKVRLHYPKSIMHELASVQPLL